MEISFRFKTIEGVKAGVKKQNACAENPSQNSLRIHPEKNRALHTVRPDNIW